MAMNMPEARVVGRFTHRLDVSKGGARSFIAHRPSDIVPDEWFSPEAIATSEPTVQQRAERMKSWGTAHYGAIHQHPDVHGLFHELAVGGGPGGATLVHNVRALSDEVPAGVDIRAMSEDLAKRTRYYLADAMTYPLEIGGRVSRWSGVMPNGHDLAGVFAESQVAVKVRTHPVDLMLDALQLTFKADFRMIRTATIGSTTLDSTGSGAKGSGSIDGVPFRWRQDTMSMDERSVIATTDSGNHLFAETPELALRFAPTRASANVRKGTLAFDGEVLATGPVARDADAILALLIHPLSRVLVKKRDVG